MKLKDQDTKELKKRPRSEVVGLVANGSCQSAEHQSTEYVYTSNTTTTMAYTNNAILKWLLLLFQNNMLVKAGWVWNSRSTNINGTLGIYTIILYDLFQICEFQKPITWNDYDFSNIQKT